MVVEGCIMKKIQALIVLATALLSFSFPATASLNRLYDELKNARSEVYLTDKEHSESMAKSIAVIAGCNMDELCTMIALKHMSTNEDNLLYIHFYNRLLKQRDDILFNALHCQSAELAQTRSTISSCLTTLNQRLTKSFTASDQIKAENALKNCTLTRLSRLAENDNIFAQAKMLEYELSKANEEGIVYWYDKMRPLYATHQYQVYSECSGKF